MVTTGAARRTRTPRVVAAVLFAAAIFCAAAKAAHAETKAILLLHTYGFDTPLRVPFDAAFVRAMREATDLKVDLYIETIDQTRFSGDLQTQRTRAYLRERYGGKRIAVVATVYDRALAFLLNDPEPLFPGVPVAAMLTAPPPPSLAANVSIIWSGETFGDSAVLALRLHPRARQIALVDSAPPDAASDAVYAQSLSQVQQAAGNAAVIELRNLPIDDLSTQLAALPAETPVLVKRQLLGVRGEPIATAEAVRALTDVATGPIYVSADQQIGFGAIGGVVVVMEREAARLAALALRIAGNAALRVPPEQGVPVPIFDWRELRRWGIAEDRLPPDSIVRFRDSTFWELYRWRIIGVLSLCLVQTVLIGTLLTQRVQRRRAEREQHKADQNVRLMTGRLLLLQDEERRRVAAELHDGLGQSLAIIKNRVTMCRNAASDEEQVKEQLDEISATAASAIDEVREIAHNLRPYELDRLGLGAAIESMIGRVADSTSIQVSARTDRIDGMLSPESETSVYRIVQEGLNNVVRHSNATTAQVEIKRSERQFVISIEDNGRGMSRAAAQQDGRHTRGFGLAGIAERVRMLGGVLTIDTAPARGTRLTVRLESSDAAR
jgi:signal transduction histidine kinase